MLVFREREREREREHIPKTEPETNPKKVEPRLAEGLGGCGLYLSAVHGRKLYTVSGSSWHVPRTRACSTFGVKKASANTPSTRLPLYRAPFLPMALEPSACAFYTAALTRPERLRNSSASR